MADDSRMTMRELVEDNHIGAFVLGVDKNGTVVPSKILRVWDRGPTEDWLRVQVRKSGGPNPGGYIYCTSKHRFFVKGKDYVYAKDLSIGDMVLRFEKSAWLSDVAKEVLFGALLGDGSLHIHHKNKALVQIAHKSQHIQYLEYIKSLLGNSARGYSKYKSGFGTAMIKLSTACSRAIYEEFSPMVGLGKKQVPAFMADRLTPLSLAIWYMDDGTLQHNGAQRDRAQFSTCGFDRASVETLVYGLSRMGIESSIHEYNGYLYISVLTDGSQKFFEIIRPYIPPVMQYKLPVKMRGSVVKKLKTPTMVNDLHTYEVPVMAIDRRMPMLGKPRNGLGRSCYDIETETGNFFANGILVHNCTTLYSDGLHARSLDFHTDVRRDWIRAFHAQIAHEIPENWRLCGENLFAKHSIAYDNLASYFLGFSVWNDKNICLPWDETIEWFKLLGIETVPVLYDGEYRGFLKDRERFMDPAHEGYVIRLACGFSYRDFRRCVAKYVRKDHVQTSEHWKSGPVVKNRLAGVKP